MLDFCQTLDSAANSVALIMEYGLMMKSWHIFSFMLMSKMKVKQLH